MWAKGAMTGACQIPAYTVGCPLNPPPACPDPNYSYCPSMDYVQNTMWESNPPHYILDSYFQIANQYGWANYMFQTSQGPSFPAHQFLFSGTSAPIQYGDINDPCESIGNKYPCWEWFDAENVGGGKSNDTTTGCIANTGRTSKQIDPDSTETFPPNPLGFANGYPCYDHPTLSDLLSSNSPQSLWKYYARSRADLWNAPTAVNHICVTNGGGNGGSCAGTEWQTNVGAVLPTSNDAAPFLTDIANCNLADMSWVIPDGNWSDHSSFVQPGDGGPSWVAAIVNAVGQSSCTDMVNGQPVSYWHDTVILITWDDWGGLYDDVVPPNCPGPLPCTGYSNSGTTNGQQYVYGFRVPLLVVSAYAKPSYISGGPSQGEVAPYTHDFGSILNFIEYAFGTGGQPLGGQYGIGDPHWPYADHFAPDGNLEYPGNPYSLYDFFNFKQIQTPTFTPITGAKYPPSCFHTPTGAGCFPTYPVDPDNDANED